MRTINEIYDAMVAEKSNLTTLSTLTPSQDSLADLLSDLNTNSKVAAWRLVFWTVSLGIYVHEVLHAAFVTEVETLVAESPTGTPRWYKDQVLLWQHDDQLTFVDNKFQYVPVDASARLVSRCAVQERVDGLVLVKVAKDDGTGALEELESAELLSLNSYISQIKFAGTRISAISTPADQLQIAYSVKYDAQITLSTIQVSIQEVVESFLSELPFNGALNVTKLTDAIQGVEGVVDPVYQAGTATPHAQAAVSIGREYIPASGYFELASAVSQSFTFTPA